MSYNNALHTNQQATARAMERMATGSAINRGSDDPAGLIASENHAASMSANNARIRSLERSIMEGNIAEAQPGMSAQDRAEIGTQQRSDEAMMRVHEQEHINTAAAYSQIRDTDYARESSNMVRGQILEQASIAAILAGRVSAESVLSLLDIHA